MHLASLLTPWQAGSSFPLPTLKQPPAHIPYAKAYPSGVPDVLIVGAVTK